MCNWKITKLKYSILKTVHYLLKCWGLSSSILREILEQRQAPMMFCSGTSALPSGREPSATLTLSTEGMGLLSHLVAISLGLGKEEEATAKNI